MRKKIAELERQLAEHEEKIRRLESIAYSRLLRGCLTIAEAANECGVSETTVKKWITRGCLPIRKRLLYPRGKCIHVNDLDDAITSGLVTVRKNQFPRNLQQKHEARK